jgi:hypothetical protein
MGDFVVVGSQPSDIKLVEKEIGSQPILFP